MAIDVTIPAVGESITSGTIAQWHKTDGEIVERGDILLTLETDKVSTELEAEESGTLHILAREGEEVAIGAVVATIDEDGGAAAETAERKAREPDRIAPAEEPAAADGIAVSPTVRKFAEEKGVDLETIEGTGKKGFITKADVEKALAESPEESAEEEKPRPEAAAEKEPSGEEEKRSKPSPQADLTVSKSEKAATPAKPSDKRITRHRLSPLRRKIATHLVSAQQTAAILTTFNECDMSAVIAMRKQLQDAFTEKYGVKLGFMSFFIKAVVDALQTVPQLNARLDGDDLVQHHYYDIGVAVGTERGLVVPVLRDCDQKSFAEIERALREYALRARDGKILLEDLQGGVFTVSNGGIYGSMLSTPILNSPQSGILGMHTIQERPVAVNGEVAIRPMMYLALSYDHRVVDGKEAVTFLVRVKDCMEDPARMLIEA